MAVHIGKDNVLLMAAISGIKFSAVKERFIHRSTSRSSGISTNQKFAPELPYQLAGYALRMLREILNERAGAKNPKWYDQIQLL